MAVPGQGSTFTVSVDAGPDDGAAWATGLSESLLQPVGGDEAEEDVKLDGARVLLAEDGFDNQRLITLYLATAGAEVTLAENGRVALDRLTGMGDRPFDLVLMDMQMPELDGYSAAAEARRRGATLPIVALTAHAMSDDRARCLAPDLIVRTNGSISLVHSDSTVDGIEMQVSKKTLLAFYYGGAYIGRDTTIDTTATKPVLVGYGQPGTTQNRNVQEITFDWTQTLWKHPSYGSLALINQYSYVLRDPWAVVGSGPKDGHTNLFYVNLRYTLP